MQAAGGHCLGGLPGRQSVRDLSPQALASSTVVASVLRLRLPAAREPSHGCGFEKRFPQARACGGFVPVPGAVQSGGWRWPWIPAKVKGLNKDPLDAATDADFWAWIRQCYSTSPDVINLNSGGVSSSAQGGPGGPLLQATKTQQPRGRRITCGKIVDKGREPLRAKLATLAGCDPEELAINLAIRPKG